MPIERDIKVIKERQKSSRTKTSQEIKTLARRQTIHEKGNNKQFQIITNAIALLPTQDVITKTIQDTIKVVVNGKIDSLKVDVATTNNKADLIGEHLKKQDINIESLTSTVQTIDKKTKPLIGGLDWATDLGKIVLYIGAIALTIETIIQVLQFFKIIK